MAEFIWGLISVGFNIIIVLISIILAFLAAIVATFKGRSAILWGLLTLLFFPTFFIVLIIPRKMPRFNSYLKNEPAFMDKNPVAASIMALAAIVAKSDGVVSKDEINLIRRFVIENFRMSKQELNSYEGAFNYGKDHPDEYEEFIRIIRIYYSRKDYIIAISYLLLSIAHCDSKMKPEEEQKLKQIITHLGLSLYEYESINNYFVNGEFGGYGGSSYDRPSYERYDSRDRVKKYAQILNVSPEASLSEIKKAYREMAKKYHPDKMASEGMPDSYMEYANKKIAEINEAYEYLKRYKEGNQ